MKIVTPKEGKETLNENRVVGTKLLSKDEVDVVHLEIAPGRSLPVHTTPTEVFFYILEGTGEAEVGEERRPVGRDTLVESLRDIPHGLHNTGTGPFRVLVVKTPRPI
ncbi:MAG: cupin domain-containing protein [Spirochaetaceae bacterium]|nr:cupin domain-containing protein [Spirochaetaceae bacterium]MDT8298070.1 cupin domain-containing protein [Spirochaetaceae bacterium]